MEKEPKSSFELRLLLSVVKDSHTISWNFVSKLTSQLRGGRNGRAGSEEGEGRKKAREAVSRIFHSFQNWINFTNFALFRKFKISFTLIRGTVKGWRLAIGWSKTCFPSESLETRNKRKLSRPQIPAFEMTIALIAIFMVFFYWFCPKNSKCQPVSKFWHLELFWWDLLCNLILFGRNQ